MSLTRSTLAKRIDRLSRGAHAFHRFAHHPLCGEYASEVFRVGRRARLCRGCTLAAIGAFAGVGIALATSPSWIVAAAASTSGLALASARMRPAGKIATRLLPAGLLAYSIASGGVLLALLGVAATVLCVVRYRRRGPERGPCARCPERTRPEPCRGFAAIVRRERAFERRVGSWMVSAPPSNT